jgi:transcriptional regulator with GAF, ATPase, and Fis domain
MPNSDKDEYAFFSEAVQSVASSLDLPRAMLAIYEFLKRHFPLEALSFHRFERHLDALQLLFLVTDGQFRYLNEFVHMPEEAKKLILMREKEGGVNYVAHTLQRPVTHRIGQAIDAHLPNIERAALIAMLSAKDRVIGHLNLIGNRPACFTPAHQHKFSILRPAFSLVMMNLLKHKEVVDLQERLSEHNRQLVSEVNLLREVEIVGVNGGLRPIMDIVGQLSGRDVPVLITGETGTGKELVANAIQRVSARSQAPFVKVNCGAIPDSLIDSELFGHEKGAFTGAVSNRPGRFEQAHGGTLFLDEVGDMPLEAQRRLLRVLQNGILERVGGSHPIHANVRIIAATHKPMEKMIKEGRFRSDLYYRLNVFPIHVPPLRERCQDLPALVHHFIKKKAIRLRLTRTPLLAPESLPELLAYPWPGNVRELENMVERALIMEANGPVQLHRFLPPLKNRPEFSGVGVIATAGNAPECRPGDGPADIMALASGYPPPWRLDQVISIHIQRILQLCGGKVYGPGGAGERLGVNPSTLRKRMDKLGIPYGRRNNQQPISGKAPD